MYIHRCARLMSFNETILEKNIRGPKIVLSKFRLCWRWINDVGARARVHSVTRQPGGGGGWTASGNWRSLVAAWTVVLFLKRPLPFVANHDAAR